MAQKNLSGFNTTVSSAQEFNTLIQSPKKKKVSIKGEYTFSNDALNSSLSPSKKTNLIKKQRGRPKIIHDERFVVCKPKKISLALEIKLKALEDYVHEFREHSGRITFEMLVTALADSYIEQNLSQSKKERIHKEIEDKMMKAQE